MSNKAHCQQCQADIEKGRAVIFKLPTENRFTPQGIHELFSQTKIEIKKLFFCSELCLRAWKEAYRGRASRVK